MAYMREIVFSAVICGVFAGLSSLGISSCGKYVKYAASLAFLYILLSPFINETELSFEMIEDLYRIGESETVSDAHENTRDSLEIVSDEICRAAVDSAAERFSVSPNCFSIKIILGEDRSGNIVIREATVYTKGEADLIDREEIEKYFREILNCSVEVVKDEQ